MGMKAYAMVGVGFCPVQFISNNWGGKILHGHSDLMPSAGFDLNLNERIVFIFF
jgi:hypothetical protein